MIGETYIQLKWDVDSLSLTLLQDTIFHDPSLASKRNIKK